MVILDIGEAHRSDGIALYKFVEAGIVQYKKWSESAKKKRGLCGLSIENHGVGTRSPSFSLASLRLPTALRIKLK